MDRKEKLDYEQGIEQYFDKYKVYDLFEKLFKELIINQPENPIEYLIERLKRKETKRVFITGYPGTNSKKISLAVSGEQYKCITVGDLLQKEIEKKEENARQIETNFNVNSMVDDDIVIDLVRNKIIEYEEKNTSYIIQGFPRNRVQAIFLQSVGLLPDSVIVLKTSREKAEESAFEKLKSKFAEKPEQELKALAKGSVDEAELNIRAVEDVFNGFYCELPIDKYDSMEAVSNEIGKLLAFKAKTNAARRPPRIILACPPSFGKEYIGARLAEKLQIIHVSVRDLLRKEISMKNSNSREILAKMNENQLVDDKFVLKLLENRLYCSDCVINGWIVTGFPMCESQINYVENMKPEIKPSNVVLIDVEEEKLQEKAKLILADRSTGKIVIEGSDEYNSLSEAAKERLVKREQDGEERLKQRIEMWKKVSEALMQNSNVIKLDGNKKKSLIIQEIENKLAYNS